MHALQTLLEREEAERNQALAELQQAQQQAGAAQLQAEQLLAYRADYQRRWSDQFSRQGAIEIVHCYQGFMSRLEQAVAQQERIASHAEAQAQRARERVQGCEIRVASVRKLIERRLSERERVAARREQKQTDEVAQRAAWRVMTSAT
jgi:flagellar FliJ protein